MAVTINRSGAHGPRIRRRHLVLLNPADGADGRFVLDRGVGEIVSSLHVARISDDIITDHGSPSEVARHGGAVHVGDPHGIVVPDIVEMVLVHNHRTVAVPVIVNVNVDVDQSSGGVPFLHE